MKTDPDFLATAEAWIDGHASPAQQDTFQEILSEDPGFIREFADLCHTEALLRRSFFPAEARRKDLRRMLAGKVRPPLYLRWRKSSAVRWAAAVVVLVSLAGAVWKTERNRARDGVAGRADSFNQLPSGGEAVPARQAVLAPAAARDANTALRQRLERMGLMKLNLQGSLSETVQSLQDRQFGQEAEGIKLEARDEGEGRVFLKTKALIPAWQVLRLMAQQTGTMVGIEDGMVTFRMDPGGMVDNNGIAWHYCGRNELDALLVFDSSETGGKNILSKYEEKVAGALGITVSFEEAVGGRLVCSGKPRDIRVLKSAIAAAQASPVKATVSVSLITVEAGPVLPWESATPGVSAVLTQPQLSEMLTKILKHEGTAFHALAEMPVQSNQVRVLSAVSKRPDGARREFIAHLIPRSRASEFDFDVTAMLREEPGEPGALGQAMSIRKGYASLLVWYGLTGIVTPFTGNDGTRFALFVRAQAPGSDLESETTAGELEAIAIPGKPGMVRSPYLDELTGMELDVSLLKPGSSFTCPLTGRKFRIP